jgi:RNA polymerase sigma-70 factor (ECF subfamily)
MAKTGQRINHDELVVKSKTQPDALGQLYDLYYERIYRFCVHRLFSVEVAEDVTSRIFLGVAQSIGRFEGQTEQDFKRWLYAIAINYINAYIRKTSRRKKLLDRAINMKTIKDEHSEDDYTYLDWPVLYAAILKLKPEHQTILTLRFFEGMDYNEIGQIAGAQTSTVRVMIHRILIKLRLYLENVQSGDE